MPQVKCTQPGCGTVNTFEHYNQHFYCAKCGKPQSWSRPSTAAEAARHAEENERMKQEIKSGM